LRFTGDGLDVRIMMVCLAATVALAACATASAGTSAGGSDVPPVPSTVAPSETSSTSPASAQTPTTPETTTPPSAPRSTKQIVLRPVTDRRPSVGWSVAHDSQFTLDCGGAEASPSTVSPDVYSCSPSAAYAVACWSSVHASRLLCLRDPWSRKVVEMPYDGHLTKVPAPSDPHPLALQLSNGHRCLVRNGGAWTDLKGRPSLRGSYFCWRGAHAGPGEGTVLWAAGDSIGIDTSTATWTVLESTDEGESGHAHTVPVTAAYFVGNPL